MSIWIHFGINALGTLTLSGSNYTQQALMSPTREEVDWAHNAGNWLDIGVPSVRNMWRGVSRRRALLWWCIGITSLPMHLLYNSAAFSTIAAYNYTYALTIENTLNSTSSPPLTPDKELGWDSMIPQIRESQVLPPENRTKWVFLSVKECVRAYNTNFPSKNSDLLVIMHGANTMSNETVRYASSIDVAIPQPQSWIGCLGTGGDDDNLCGYNRMASAVLNGGNWTFKGYGQVKECWSKKMDEVCKLQFSTGILSIVIVCNFVKALCMLLTLCERDFVPLVTIGDAIQSFLMNPDPTTAGICHAGKHYIEAQRKLRQPWNTGEPKPLEWKPIKCRWWKAASLAQWGICVCFISVTLVATMFLLDLALGHSVAYYGNKDIKRIWDRGFGRVDQGSIILFANWIPMASAGLLANAPQTLLSFLYLLYNAIITNMLMGVEWNRYAHWRRVLRVSDPRGNQKSTYWLNVPLQYGIPLMILSGLLHWLTSQTLFLARIETYSSSGEIAMTISTAGFSTIAIIFLLPAGILTVAAAMALGFRRYQYDMPLVGSCSVAISAACHPVRYDPDAVLKQLKWGDVGGDEVRHLTFSAEDVGIPVEGKMYAGMDMTR
ncbi:hypothetical protein K440DRAFT_292787 [Wilcoxina mikolae CBS 423.85]|nr:hypothetical protein K440DRAFT_292787 [Wilcoxina mikolae CBS 423.85]